ncbi:uncharacterized protein EI97DRAFT_430400 [Westerdykella ornata]|uniref:Uncharacterized protein n=1 Tax=Westerdykella ornata TaxID=318751 RepID=A0A6A6JSR4_WESOR|nr:uncharacterized protein EI97DRAFT_430400 [Westerdykella ornata]KAF2279305.1 hypothetical protein EI97DRAFT_430400 [Westerdykella ornata]
MRLQQLALYLTTFLAACHALPNNAEAPEEPEAFKKTLDARAVGGNCNFTGVCLGPVGNDVGECIGESMSRCCHESSFCSRAGNACEMSGSNPALCS